ncbi:alanyl-tRNA editing protein AlaX, partial [Candidatus Woesearchaeota archaeon]
TLVVDKVYPEGDLIIHEGLLEGDGKPSINELVHGVLDWDRRYRLMRMHTAAHIIGCVIKKLFNADFHGGAIGVEESYDDYTARITRNDLPKIEAEANKIVEAGIPHIVIWLPRDEAEKYLEKYGVRLTELHAGLKTIRILEIKGLCAFPCGGTHVTNTREVGRIKLLKRESKGRGITRIRFTIEP